MVISSLGHLLCTQLESLIRGVPYPIANLSNAAALLWAELPDLNWAGFYLSSSDEEACLILGPFQGKPACIRIPYGKGVCGTAAAQDCILCVPDVHAFPGHIACDSASNSELVIPLHRDGRVIGVMDLDSPLFSRFSTEDVTLLQQFAAILEQVI